MAVGGSIFFGASHGVSVLLGRGDGAFEAALNYPAGGYSVAVADLNGDGKADLATSSSLLFGNGDGTFQAAINSGTSGHLVAAGDFNGDGKPDLAVASLNSSSVSVLLGKGDGTFQTAVNYGVGVGPRAVAVGDFNGDGRPDLALAQGDYGISVLLNTCVAASLNHPPVADASATPARVISPNNPYARVVVDGSRSHDIESDPLQFSWFVDGAATASATGRVAVVVLSVGTHDVRL
ncbi:MAG: hypothetical protein DME24_14385, partial [Verrucomicrobia bacterium]